MKIGEKIKECSYLWIVYVVLGVLISFIIAMSVYMMLLLWAVFYDMNNSLVTFLSQSHIKASFIIVGELIFAFIVYRGLHKETGDTILIDIIKHGDTVKNSVLLDSNTLLIGLNNIKVHLKDRVEVIDSLDKLIMLNQSEHGYIEFTDESHGLSDVCFTSDLKISAKKDSTESSNYVLKINRYRYSGYKLLGKQEFNLFELCDCEEPGDGNELGKSGGELVQLSDNHYIKRLLQNNVYDYPVSIEKDIKKGLNDSKLSFAIILFSLLVLFGINGWYRNYSSSAFMSDFYPIEVVDGMEVYTDADFNYLDYKTYIHDSLTLLPQKLKDDFVADGWKVVFVKNDLADYEMLSGMVSPGEVSGCTFPFYKLIVIKVPEKTRESDKLFLMQTIIHEYGHYLSLKTGALNKYWTEIFNKESKYYSSDYAKSSLSEGFACSYANYVLFNESFKELNPLSHDYIDTVLKVYFKDE